VIVRKLPLFDVIQIALTVALAFAVVILAISSSDLSGTIRTNQYASCVSGNATRVRTGKIITEILSLPTISKPSAQIPARRSLREHDLTTLKAEIASNYGKLNDCAEDK
jgi:hypothetical protein